MGTTTALIALTAALAATAATACGAKVTVDGDGGLLGNGGGGGGTAGGFACDEQTGGVHVCATYTNLPAADQASETAACTQEGGTAETTCSTANVLGACSVTAEGITATITYYAEGGLDAANAQMACTAGGGSWTGG
jgi:hypothetical protein